MKIKRRVKKHKHKEQTDSVLSVCTFLIAILSQRTKTTTKKIRVIYNLLSLIKNESFKVKQVTIFNRISAVVKNVTVLDKKYLIYCFNYS